MGERRKRKEEVGDRGGRGGNELQNKHTIQAGVNIIAQPAHMMA